MQNRNSHIFWLVRAYFSSDSRLLTKQKSTASALPTPPAPQPPPPSPLLFPSTLPSPQVPPVFPPSLFRLYSWRIIFNCVALTHILPCLMPAATLGWDIFLHTGGDETQCSYRMESKGGQPDVVASPALLTLELKTVPFVSRSPGRRRVPGRFLRIWWRAAGRRI